MVISTAQGTEVVVKLGSRFQSPNDWRHYLAWRHGQIIDIRPSGTFSLSGNERKHMLVIELPNVNYYGIRQSRDNKKFTGGAKYLKKFLYVANEQGRYKWDIENFNPKQLNKKDLRREWLIDPEWLLQEKYISLGQWETLYNKSEPHQRIILSSVFSLDEICKNESDWIRISNEKDTAKASINAGTYEIGAAGDYASFQTFEADIESQLTGNLTGEHLDEETEQTAYMTWDVDTNGYLLKLTAKSGAEHNGKSYGNGARVNYGTYDTFAFNESTDGTFDDVEVSNLAFDISGSGNLAINFNDGSDNGLFLANRNLIKGNSSSTSGIRLYNRCKNARIINNIIFDIGDGGVDAGVEFEQNSGGNLTFYIANNTCIGNYNNFCQVNNSVVGTLYLYNNIAQANSGGNDFADAGAGFGANHAKNISEDTTSPDTSYREINLHDGNSCFVDYDSDDFTLDSGGDEISTLDDGDDLSGTFTDDIVGTTRSTWYIGAFEIPSTVIEELSGIVETNSGASSILSKSFNISGATNSESNLNSAIKLAIGILGEVVSQLSLESNIKKSFDISGEINSESNLNSIINAAIKISGESNSQSTIDSFIKIAIGFLGQSNSQISTSAILKLIFSLVGIIVSQSSEQGTVKNEISIESEINAQTELNGLIKNALSIYGIINTDSNTIGQIKIIAALAASISSISELISILNVQDAGETQDLQGVINALSTISGILIEAYIEAFEIDAYIDKVRENDLHIEQVKEFSQYIDKTVDFDVYI